MLRRNSATYPSIESGGGWVASGGATISVESGFAKHGDSCLKIDGLDNNLSGALTGQFAVVAGERWEIGADLLGTLGNGTEALSLFFTCYDGADQYVAPLSTFACGPLDDTDWQRYTFEALIPEGAAYALFYAVKLAYYLTHEQTTYLDGLMVSKLPSVTYFAQGIAELHDSYAVKADGPVPATADSGQEWTIGSGNAFGDATPDPEILDGQLTAIHNATSLAHVQTEIDAPCTRIGATFVFEADDGEDGPTVGILVLNDRMLQMPSDYGPFRSYPNMPCHLAITPTQWWLGVVDEDVDAVEQIAFGAFATPLTPGQEYTAAVVLEGDTAHVELPDGSRHQVTDERIETWCGPFVDFEPIQGTSRSGFTAVWADSSPVGILPRLDYFDGDTASASWEGTAHASSSVMDVPDSAVTVYPPTQLSVPVRVQGFPPGTSVDAFKLREVEVEREQGRAPFSSTPDATATVDADFTATFTLRQTDTPYAAVGEVDGEHKYVTFTPDH